MTAEDKESPPHAEHRLLPPHGGYRKLRSFQTSQQAYDTSDPSDSPGIKTADPETAANTLLCLANQASFLPGRQMKTLERTFLEQGGFTERLHRERSRYRNRNPQ